MADRIGQQDIQALLDLFLDHLRAATADAVVAVALYGSVARGAARADSDIDLFVVHRGARLPLSKAFVESVLWLRAQAATMELRRRGVPTEPFPVFCRASALDDTPWLLLDIADHGVVLHDPESVLSDKLERLRARLRELGSRRITLADGSWYWDLKPDLRPGETIVI